MTQHRFTLAGTSSIVAAAAAIITPALATPARDFTRTELSTGLLAEGEARARSDKWEVRVRTKEDTTVGLDRLTVLDDGHSGWHTHAGLTIATVVEGAVTWYDGSQPGCPAKTYRAGESFIEPANNVHLVHNTTGATVVYTAVQLRPAGAPGRIDAAQPEGPGCPAF